MRRSFPALVPESALELEQVALELELAARALECAAVASECSIGSNHAMAGEHDRKRIVAHHRSDGACGARGARGFRELAVACRLAVGNARERAENAARELAHIEIERELEDAAIAGEVLLELSGRLAKNTGRLAG
jgi:hypothetical protein